MKNRIPSNVLLYGLGLLALIMGILAMDSGHEFGDDFALYLDQARCLFDSEAYSDLIKSNTYSMQNSDAIIGPNSYPIGFPIFLNIVQSLVGWNNLFWVKIILFSFFIFSVTRFLTAYSKSLTTQGAQLIFAAVVLFAPKFIESADRLLSDLLFSALVFLFFARLKNQNPNYAFDWILWVLLVFAAMVRPTGILLAVPFVFNYWKKRKYWSDVLVAFLSVVVIQLGFYLFQGKSDSIYMSTLKSGLSMDTIVGNYRYYAEMIVKMPVWNFLKMLDLLIPNCSTVLGILFSAVLIWVLFYKLWNSYTEEKLFVLLHLGLLLVWPSQQGSRLIFPIYPIYIFLLFSFFSTNLHTNLHKLNFLTSPKTSYIIGFIFLIQGSTTAYHYFKTDTNQAYSKDMESLVQFVGDTVKPNEYISFFKPRLLHYLSGKSTLRIQNDVDYSGKTLKLNKVVYRDSLKAKNILYYISPAYDYHVLKSKKSIANSAGPEPQIFTLQQLSDANLVYENKSFVVLKLNQ